MRVKESKNESKGICLQKIKAPFVFSFNVFIEQLICAEYCTVLYIHMKYISQGKTTIRQTWTLTLQEWR